MQNERNTDDRLPQLLLIAGIPVIMGLALQFVFAPEAQAWGFYELLGFTVAGIGAGIYGVRHWLQKNPLR